MKYFNFLNDCIEGTWFSTNKGIVVHGDVNLINISNIPIKFHIVYGIFNCSNNNLKSLKNSPNICSVFNCSNNELTNLKYGPKYVSTTYICSNNFLTSLNGLPNQLEELNCSYNQLTNLTGAPKTVQSIICHDNTLENLCGSPDYFYNYDKYTLTNFNSLIQDIKMLILLLKHNYKGINIYEAINIIRNHTLYDMIRNSESHIRQYFTSTELSLIDNGVFISS